MPRRWLLFAGAPTAVGLADELEAFPCGQTTLVERWRYVPSTSPKNGRTVDRLSQYLSSSADANERVQPALEELIQW